ncbi:type II/IV secretion system protein [Patescibacteria group bacterium]|nr:type II/IV secretion system protein [Patescibacteria group bacterium]
MLPPKSSSNQSPAPDSDAAPIGKIIGNIQRKSEEEQTKKLADSLGLPYLNLVNFQPEPGVVEIIPKELVENGGVFAFKKEGQKIHLAITDPRRDATLETLKQLEAMSEYEFAPTLVSESSLKYLKALYDTFAPNRVVREDIHLTSDQQKQALDTIKNWNSLGDEAKRLAISNLFDTLLSGATYTNASDIHIEPTKTNVRLRFRVDGVLSDMVDLPKELLRNIISRIKLLAGLKLNIADSAQDGRFSIKAGDADYDLRVSILPTAYGESAVLRLLPQSGSRFISLTDLGLTGHNAEIINNVIRQPNGLILNTGPTGSGKTTTLYAILSEINQPGKKIITIEDPIEYRLSGITQSQVDPDEGYTFANGLKSILRQDPDVVLVGEIRDNDTAAVAINASLTGHLVLSTLHTNDAAGAIPRLGDLGLKPEYFIEAILGVIAQRLVRRVCPHCAEDYTPTAAELKIINKELSAWPSNIEKPVIPTTLKRPNPKKLKTCPNCNGTGYKGQLGIFEVMQPNETIVKAVIAKATVSEIQRLAIESGMITLRQDGITKVIAGTTSLSEIERVTGDFQSGETSSPEEETA